MSSLSLPHEAKSYWMEDVPKPAYPSLQGSAEVDVAIIGAGIAGLTAAYMLKQRGLKVAVVDKKTIGAGVSGHTTGKVTSQHNLIYAKLARRLGEATAREYAEANQSAVSIMEDIIQRESIDCGWQTRDSYVYTTDARRQAEFDNEARVAKSFGLPASYETQTDLPFAVAGAVRFSGQAHLHIRKYLVGLARSIDGSGSSVYEKSDVTSIQETKGELLGRIATQYGEIYARDIIVATNVPTLPLLARGTYCIGEYPQQSYVIAGLVDNMPGGMYISPDKNHYSILPVTHGSSSLLLIGGEAHIPGTRLNSDKRYQRLADYAERHFGMQKVAHKWTARDYLGYDDMPLIGPLYPWSRHIYTATGFMKWGLTNGTMAAGVLTDAILGIDNQYAKTFYPHRASVMTSIPKVIGENIGIL